MADLPREKRRYHYGQWLGAITSGTSYKRKSPAQANRDRQRVQAFREKKAHVDPVQPMCGNNTSDSTVTLTVVEHAVEPDIARHAATYAELTAPSLPSRRVTRSSAKQTLAADPVEQMRDASCASDSDLNISAISLDESTQSVSLVEAA